MPDFHTSVPLSFQLFSPNSFLTLFSHSTSFPHPYLLFLLRSSCVDVDLPLSTSPRQCWDEALRVQRKQWKNLFPSGKKDVFPSRSLQEDSSFWGRRGKLASGEGVMAKASRTQQDLGDLHGCCSPPAPLPSPAPRWQCHPVSLALAVPSSSSSPVPPALPGSLGAPPCPGELGAVFPQQQQAPSLPPLARAEGWPHQLQLEDSPHCAFC